MSHKLTRRNFIKTSAIATTTFAIGSSAHAAPSNRITLGFIGVGGHGGGYNLPNFLKISEAQVVTVCDVMHDRKMAARKQVNEAYSNKDCDTCYDFRQILARKDIDAVVISTPDHWHVPLSILAANAGKDVFCEKPTLTIDEGPQLIEAVERNNIIYQGGIEDRSVDIYHRLAELVRNGVLGKLEKIQISLLGGDIFPKEEPVPVPKNLNYDMWLGPAPYSPYTPTKLGPQEWRNQFDYSGGKLTDWGAHLIDTAQVAIYEEHGGPLTIEGKGDFPKDAMTNTALNYTINYTYPNGVKMTAKSGGTGIAFIGSEGWAHSASWRAPIEASSPDILNAIIPYNKNKMYPIPVGEHQAFINGVKSRKAPYYTPKDIHHLSTTMHLGNIAMLTGRKIEWDPKKEKIIGDKDANKYRSRVAREGWSVKELA
ncbi:MAG: Gfo/Idh/MocA family oxidoreductase [Candidatus Hydrogenedentota bacterium]